MRRVTLRRSTRIWLAIFLVASGAAVVANRVVEEPGCLGLILTGTAMAAGLLLLARGVAAAFRLIIRRLTLRLAFSYFLIGIVPIPLLATLLFLASYMVAHQYVANRLRREITVVGERAVQARRDLPGVRVDANRKILSSDVPWLPPGETAWWLESLQRPGFVNEGEDVWLAVLEPDGSGARLLRLMDPDAPWLQELADRTGYTVSLEAGEAKTTKTSIQIDPRAEPEPRGLRVGTDPVWGTDRARRPKYAPPEGKGVWRSDWIHAFYLETAANAVEEKAETGKNVAVLAAKTSPRVLFEQLFAQGVAEVGNILWIAFVGVGGALLLVYLVALAIAFILVSSITRNVNRLTRATEAIARGDFSVRVRSKSRDQIGDLANSFDTMAESIERLLAETKEKQRLESEVAVARTIQHKLLPPAQASLPGMSVLAHFEPVAEIGGDYYDYLPMPDGRTALALGDVSGHGLPIGLLVAMVKAALSTLIEAGHQGPDLFTRLNELIHRSTDPRHYMTLALLAYDAKTRIGTLTNAGQLAPYRISGGMLEPLALPSFPLGLFPEKSFPSKSFEFRSGDLVLLVSDGFVEAIGPRDEPFGFERLEALLRARAAEGTAAVRDALLSAIHAHTGGRPPDDDRTLLFATLE